MNNEFFSYLQQLETMAFFSGYPILFAVIHYISGNENIKFRNKKNLVLLLPYTYALVGIFYLGFQLKKVYLNYIAFEEIQWQSYSTLTLWAFLSLAFGLSFLRKKILLSLLHSFVFFFFIIKDIVQQLLASAPEPSVLRNDMNVYTDSLLMNAFVYTFTFLSFYWFSSIKK